MERENRGNVREVSHRINTKKEKWKVCVCVSLSFCHFKAVLDAFERSNELLNEKWGHDGGSNLQISWIQCNFFFVVVRTVAGYYKNRYFIKKL